MITASVLEALMANLNLALSALSAKAGAAATEFTVSVPAAASILDLLGSSTAEYDPKDAKN
jgi:hypothetical protein